MAFESGEKPPSVSKLTLMLVVWIGCFIATAAVCLRAFLRLRYHSGFQLDDAFTVFALALLIASAIMYTVAMDPLFHMVNIASGAQVLVPEDLEKFMSDTSLFLRLQFAITIVFWTCLWVVKSCFLTFFYPLSNGLKVDRILWYVVTAFATASYIVCVISYPLSCSEFTIEACQADHNIQLSIMSLKMSTALDISTDILIILLPWKLLWVVKRSRKEKLIIGSIVGLGVLIILFAVIRIIVTNTTRTHPEPVWLALWSSIETTVAVVVISLTSLKVLFAKSGSSRSGYAEYDSKNSGYASRGKNTYSRGNTAGGGEVSAGAIELTDQAQGSRHFIHNGEVRKGALSSESEEILVK